MASVKQTIANRLNSMKSTGPRSAIGRLVASKNSTKHGLSRLGATPPAELAGAIADRKRNWRDDYRPVGPAQEWLFERLCAESVRLDACECRILAARAEAAERAAESWDDDRSADVAALAARLAGRPEVIQPKLLQSKHGVLWLLERWGEVSDSLPRCDGWTPETWGRAMDLLGVSAEARVGTGPWDLDAEDGGAGPGLELVRRGVEGLRSRLETYLDARDARARDDAEAGLGDESPEVRRLERYAADARRQFAWCRDELRRQQAAMSPSRAVPAAPRPADAPPPRPVRARATAPPNAPPDPAPPLSSPATPGPEVPTSRATVPGGSFSAALRDRIAPPAPALNRRARRALAAASRRS